MIADFFTKPLQGKLFRKFRDIVLGYKHVSSLLEEEESSPQERVRRNIPEGMDGGSEDDLSSQLEGEKKKVTWAEVVTGKPPMTPMTE